MKVITNMLFDFHNDCIDLRGNIIFTRISSSTELEEYKNAVLSARLDYEHELAQMVLASPERVLQFPGFSETAGQFTDFRLDMNYSNGTTPNFRERLICPVTNLNNRQRFICSYLKKLSTKKGYTSLFTFEQATPVFRFISHNLGGVNIMGSEYLSPEYRPGQIVNGIRHEDALNLSFTDESFDIVLTCEVLDRTPDIYQAIGETYRVMKEGGTFLFSTPFNASNPASQQRAKLTTTGIEHLSEAKYYHGNHTIDKQSPVFYDIGWDLLDIIKERGFKNVHLLCYYSATYGYMGEGLQSIFVAEK